MTACSLLRRNSNCVGFCCSWCLISGPLLISTDLNSISNESLAILKHEELITINQDANGIQGVRVSPPQPEGAEVWAKQLTVASASGSGGGSSNASSLSVAVVFLNRASDGKARDISTTWEMLPGFKGVTHAGHQVRVRDIWLRKDLDPVGGQGYVARNVRAHSVVVLKFTVVRPLPNE